VHPFHFLEFWSGRAHAFKQMTSGEISCISNVCTHRGNILCQIPANQADSTAPFMAPIRILQGGIPA